MPISRRKLLLSAATLPVAGAAVGAVAAVATASPPSTSTSGADGDVVGKVTVGYQGWFACIGDGAPIDAWWHWSDDNQKPPSMSNGATGQTWPDMSAYAHQYQTAYADLGNGAPATLFSSVDQQVVDTHLSWMQFYGCDTLALQRFDPDGSEGPSRNEVAAMVNTAAQAYDRKFYIMYDATGWTDMATQLPADWTNLMSKYAESPAYAHQNGKPVVGIWGFGFGDDNHPWPAADCLAVIKWLQDQGCYVMGGVPTGWLSGTGDSRAGYLDVYTAFDMLSPWMVGRIGDAADSDWHYENNNLGDQKYCDAHGIDYQPCVLPGADSLNERAHGDFMWEQFYNMTRLGAQGIYISMFDEFGEGNQIVNSAPDQSTMPTNTPGYAGLNSDGTVCSADYYLRLTGDGAKMLKRQLALTNVRPTPTEQATIGAFTVTASAYTGSGGGVQTQATSDFGGGVHVGYITDGAWLKYENIDFADGYSTVQARIAAQGTGYLGTIQFRLDSATATPISTIPVIGTGGWQNWTTTAPASLGPVPTGTHTVYVTFQSSGTGYLVNVNGFTFAGGGNGSAPNTAVTIVASAFSGSSGAPATQTTADSSGGENVGYLTDGATLRYDRVDFGSGYKTLTARIASAVPGTGVGSVALRLDSPTATPIATIEVNGTGGWQNWTTTAPISLSHIPASLHTLYVTFDSDHDGSFVNLNWFSFTEGSGGSSVALPEFPLTVNATAYTTGKSVRTQSTADYGGGSNVGWVTGDSQLEYPGVNFGSGRTGQVLVRLASDVAATASGTIQLRVGSPTAEPFATIGVNGTGGWQNWLTASTFASPVPAGIQTLYVTFADNFSGYFVNLNWIQFR